MSSPTFLFPGQERFPDQFERLGKPGMVGKSALSHSWECLRLGMATFLEWERADFWEWEFESFPFPGKSVAWETKSERQIDLGKLVLQQYYHC